MQHRRVQLACRVGIWFAAALGIGIGTAQAACYTVYNRSNNQIIYRSMNPPVDLSKPLNQTMPEVFPQGYLVFTPSNVGCEAETLPEGWQPRFY